MRRVKSAIAGNLWGAVVSGSVVGVLIFAILIIWRGARGETIVLEVQPVGDPSMVRVYVGGEVVTPGLVTLPRGSRVVDAIEAAGGATANGDLSGFGLAAPLEDADQIIVPSTRRISTTTPDREFTDGGRPTSARAQPTELVNINTASQTELERLPGIGPALANRIIAHRNAHGPYQSIDELESIDGISQRMVDELRRLVTIGT
jgi:competence protein ComEA